MLLRMRHEDYFDTKLQSKISPSDQIKKNKLIELKGKKNENKQVIIRTY